MICQHHNSFYIYIMDNHVEMSEVVPELESQLCYNQTEESKLFRGNCNQTIQAIVDKNDVEKAKFLLNNLCINVLANVKCRNGDSKKKLAQLDKQTSMILTKMKNQQITDEKKTQAQIKQKYNLTYQECSSKLIRKKDNPQEQKNQSFNQFYIFAEQLTKHFQIKNQKKLMQDLKSKQFKLIRFYNYKVGDQEKWANFINCLQSFPQYQDYRKYLGVNIKLVKRNFENWLKNKLIQNQQFDALEINFLSKRLIEDPLWPFWNDQKISDLQKQSLFKILYQQEKMLKYVEKLQIPESIKSQNLKTIELILNELVEKQYIRNNQVQSCIQSLEKNDDIQFYSLASITTYRKVISKFFDSNGQSFFFEQKNIRGKECPKKMQTETIIEIRKLLHSLKVNFSLYQEIEDKILNLKVDNLWDVMISPITRQKIIKKIENEKLFVQYRKYRSNFEVPLDIKVRNEIQKTLINLDFRNLDYKQIKNFAQKMVKKRINLSRFLTPQQVKDFQDNIQKCENYKKFFADCQVNITSDQAILREKILFICNDCPELLRLDSITQIINHVLKTSNIQKIYDFSHISLNQKKYLVEALIASKQYQIFRQSFEKIQAIRSERQLEQQIIKQFTERGRVLFYYYQLFGRYQQKHFNTTSQSLPQLKNFQTRIKQLLDLQESQNYKKFKNNFKLLFNVNKMKVQEQFSNDVRFILQRRRGPVDAIIRDLQQSGYQIEKSIPLEYQDSIKADVGYKELMKWMNAQKINIPFFDKINFEKTVTNIYYHTSLLKYNQQQRSLIIEGLLKKGVNFLKETDLIRQSQKAQIRSLLLVTKQEQQQQQQHFEQPQIKEQKSLSPQQICNQIKKLTPFQFIEKMTVQEIRAFFKDYPFNQEKVSNILTQYPLPMKKKSSFRESINKKDQILKKLKQLQIATSKSQTSSPTKLQKKQLSIQIPSTPKSSQIKKKQQEQPVQSPILPVVRRKSRQEASNQILDLFAKSNFKSERFNAETVMGFFRNQFNPDDSGVTFGIPAVKRKAFNEFVKNNLQTIKQLSKSFE